MDINEMVDRLNALDPNSPANRERREEMRKQRLAIIQTNLEASRALLEGLDKKVIVSLSAKGEVSVSPQEGAAEVLVRDLLNVLNNRYRGDFEGVNTYVEFDYEGIDFYSTPVVGGSFIPPSPEAAHRALTEIELRNIRAIVQASEMAAEIALCSIDDWAGSASDICYRRFYLKDGRITTRPVPWAHGLNAKDFLKEIKK